MSTKQGTSKIAGSGTSNLTVSVKKEINRNNVFNEIKNKDIALQLVKSTEGRELLAGTELLASKAEKLFPNRS